MTNEELKKFREKMERRTDCDRLKNLAKHRRNLAAKGQHLKLVTTNKEK